MVAPSRFTDHDLHMDYPELAARTRRFTIGAPRTVTVTAGGERVIFLRSTGPDDPVDRLWVHDVGSGVERMVIDPTGTPTSAAELPPAERALRERMRLSATGLGSYAIDAAGEVAVTTHLGQLVSANLVSGVHTRHADTADVLDPRLDPAGRRVAYVANGALRVRDLATGVDSLLAGEAGNATVTWGMAEFVAAEEFGRFRGYWWSPDGGTILAARVDNSRVSTLHLHDPAHPELPSTPFAYPLAGTANAQVTLHLLDLDGGWVDVHWDRETYPYLISVSWSEMGGPLITVLRRLQQHGLVLAIDPRTGETQVHAELADPRWVEPVPGTPCHLADGRVLIGGELAHDGYDARCLFADGSLLTPPSLYVRRVRGRLSALGERGANTPDGDLLVEASDGEPSEQHLFRVATHGGSGSVDVRRLTTTSGWHEGYAGGETLVIAARSLDHSGTQWSVYAHGERVGQLRSYATAAPYSPRPALERVTDRRLPTGVLYPRSHVAGRRLPVLVDIYGGPGAQEVLAIRAKWQERQWWADAGFAVVVVDNRGTPGVAPSFEKVIHRRLADMILGDQVDGLAALADKHPDLDLSRVAIRGWSFGGWLAALAVLRRPDIYHCGVAGAPVTDWALYDTAYTERYLGTPTEGGEVYAHNSLLESAAEQPLRPEDARPLLLIHGLMDDNVFAAHTMRLSAALLASGRPHAVIPITSATHMAAGGAAERLLPLELDFVRRHLR